MVDNMAREEIIRACHMAWQTGLMRGFSGNASVRQPDGGCLITATGMAKGRLTDSDILELGRNGEVAGKAQGKPSLEKRLHLGLYESYPACNAILHTHPASLQALELRLKGTRLADAFLNIALTEADYWRERVVIAPEHAPGSPELAGDAITALGRRWRSDPPLPCAVWLSGHGLCALGENMAACLGLSEQLDHIAQVQLATI